MPPKNRPANKPGPMGTQPIEHGSSTPTQMLPIMPGTTEEKHGKTKEPAAPQKTQTRAEAVRAVLARITRRNSLRKQREAQKS
jgi:hypothetical protein